MRAWQVGGALIRCDGGLVLVANRRRDRSVDWTPPGGVIDDGETVHQGVGREVHEETGLIVERFTRCAYRVEVEAPDMDWILSVETWEVDVVGDVEAGPRTDDPDGIVEECRAVPFDEARSLLASSPPWIHVPVGEWLGRAAGALPAIVPQYRFRLHGSDRSTARAERLA